MKHLLTILPLSLLTIYISSCNHAPTANNQPSCTIPELAEFINNIKAIDNHAHPNTIDPNDKDYDALPLDGLGNIELPARVRPESPDWLAAYKVVYGFTGAELNEKVLKDLMDTTANLIKQKGEKFPTWVLDQTGIEVMLANRINMGPGISAPRFRWVAYVDALLFPLSTKAEAAVTPDRELLFPMEDQHLKEFLSALKLSKPPTTLDEYLKQVVTPTLEAQKNGGCVAVKFEAGYLRSLDFEKVPEQSAAEIYKQYICGSVPPNENYKLLQDFIFYYIAREAGRLGMAVHIHSLTAFGNYYDAAESDPILLESVFNDSELRNTKFVLLHGGGIYSQHTAAMLWKPNVYVDISMLTRIWSPDKLASVLRDWLSQFPEKVLFGTDACSFGPGLGWELGAYIASQTARQALTLALSAMVNDHEITLRRAKEIATMVMRTNAANLYNLGLQ